MKEYNAIAIKKQGNAHDFFGKTSSEAGNLTKTSTVLDVPVTLSHVSEQACECDEITPSTSIVECKKYEKKHKTKVQDGNSKLKMILNLKSV